MIQRFGDVAIDPENVIAVSRQINDDAAANVATHDQSGLVLRDTNNQIVVINISANGAAALLEHFGKNDPANAEDHAGGSRD
jgi:hypothetical protein